MKLMNDYLDEDIKFDEGMNVKEDDSSIKSSASTSSLDSVENSPTNITDKKNSNPSPIKSLFKSNVKKVMNNLKISKPILTPLSEQNVSISFSEIDDNLNKITDSNISQMLDSLIGSDYTELNSNHETINAVISDANLSLNETIICDSHAVKTEEIVDNTETIYGHVSETINEITETIESANKLEQTEAEEEEEEADELENESEKNDNLETKVNKKKRNRKKKK
jgi:septal ring factor EnvC (AmiA/AmiB activator)